MESNVVSHSVQISSFVVDNSSGNDNAKLSITTCRQTLQDPTENYG